MDPVKNKLFRKAHCQVTISYMCGEVRSALSSNLSPLLASTVVDAVHCLDTYSAVLIMVQTFVEMEIYVVYLSCLRWTRFPA